MTRDRRGPLYQGRWADTIDTPCPRCGAGPREECVNPITGVPSKLPCLDRYKAADRRRAARAEEDTPTFDSLLRRNP